MAATGGKRPGGRKMRKKGDWVALANGRAYNRADRTPVLLDRAESICEHGMAYRVCGGRHK